MQAASVRPNFLVLARGSALRRIVFVCFKARGHIYAATALSRNLEKLGFDVSFVGAPSAKPIFDELGRDFKPMECLDLLALPFGIERRPQKLRNGNVGGKLRKATKNARNEVTLLQSSFAKIRSELGSVIDELRPELAVFDPFLLLYSLPFQAKGVPVVTMCSMILATPDPIVPPLTEYLVPGMPLYRTRVRIAWLRQHIYYALWERWEKMMSGASLGDLVSRFGKVCGVDAAKSWRPRPILFDARFDNCAEWVLHAREFDLPRMRELDHEVHFVGPVADLERDERKADISASGRPIVFAALSTVRNADPRLRRRILDVWLRLAKNRSDLFFVISADDHAEVLKPEQVPDNVQVFALAPSIEILRQASLVMTQAGANVVKEAIWHDVPLLLLPLRADQPGVAARVLFHGLGLAHPSLPSWQRLSSDIDELMDDPIWKTRVIAMRKAFEGYDDLRALEIAVQSALKGQLDTSKVV